MPQGDEEHVLYRQQMTDLWPDGFARVEPMETCFRKRLGRFVSFDPFLPLPPVLVAQTVYRCVCGRTHSHIPIARPQGFIIVYPNSLVRLAEPPCCYGISELLVVPSRACSPAFMVSLLSHPPSFPRSGTCSADTHLQIVCGSLCVRARVCVCVHVCRCFYVGCTTERTNHCKGYKPMGERCSTSVACTFFLLL